ncbi:peptidoglycan-binding protein [Caballeronia novacaledonica]|uniref:Uncharacterized protein n=1 Tax=Caballeronia novacaledonica TaxID=1544861 RepID=A0AA37IGU0_9BURK|nr:peptidoglycan-binding protein [Caballeronia novacaledonica]GJH28942.1 hypothetical protein CBA19CS42_30520 [Caballeronia novacaledonica]
MIDTLELAQVQSIDVTEREALEQHEVPALEGDFLQSLGRRAARVGLSGVLAGDEAAGALKTLREQHRQSAPLPFVCDIATATRLDQMLIEDLQVREVAGKPSRFAYRIDLVEYTPAPPGQHEDPPRPPDPPPAPPPSTVTGSLLVRVIVDGEPSFDFSQTRVRVEGQQDDGAKFGADLDDRDGNEWTRDPMPPGAYVASATTQDSLTNSGSGTVVAGQRAEIEIHLRPGPPVAKSFVVHYWFDRAFIEPCLRSVLRTVADYARAHPDEKMLIVGQTDLSGSPTYNQALSERRARGVYAYLTAGSAAGRARSVAEWNALRAPGAGLPDTRLADSWGVREYQHMLSGLGYYGGGIDEVHGPRTDAAVRNFQSDHGLSVDGGVGDATWQALIEAYLSDDPPMPGDLHLMPNCPGEFIAWLGSGEQNPVDREKPHAWRRNRRTEIAFVRANAMAGKVAPPVTFELPAPGTFGATWCAGGETDPVTVFSRDKPQPDTFLIQPAETGNVDVQVAMSFEDGSPAANIRYVLIAPDGEFMDGEHEVSPDSGRPIAGKTGADGTFVYERTKGVGVYILSIEDAFTVRLKASGAGGGASHTVCARLEAGARLEVVLAPDDGIDPRRKLDATLFGRGAAPLANTAVELVFPDGGTSQATTDADGHLSVVMSDAFATVKMRYQASADANDVIALDYFIDVGAIGDDEGVSRRLRNLGFQAQEDRGAAVAMFQAMQGINPSGEIDDATRSLLSRVHTGEAPLFPPVDDTPGAFPTDAPADP